jgi:hypothetical protein
LSFQIEQVPESDLENTFRKGRVGWVAKGDVIAKARFIAKLFAIAA